MKPRIVGTSMSTPRVFLSFVIAALTAVSAMGQTATRPPVGGVASLPDAMIFYVAHGPLGACGPEIGRAHV